MIAVIDTGVANIASVVYALQRLGLKSTVTKNSEEIGAASHVILPGVGSAPALMQSLEKYQLVSTIKNLTQPALGICLGLQVLFEYSEEDNTACLGLMTGDVSKLTGEANLIVNAW